MNWFIGIRCLSYLTSNNKSHLLACLLACGGGDPSFLGA
jgi:hypothetical protein